MRLRVGDPALVPGLLAYLRQRPDCIAVDAGDGVVAVSLLGSLRAEENVAELEARLEGWRALNSGATVAFALAA